MGEAEIDKHTQTLTIHSHFIFYGNASSAGLAQQMAEETEALWNDPYFLLPLQGISYRIVFRITAAVTPTLSELDVLQNTNPRNNYFRIEEYVTGNISFVDGLGCNTGFFKLENLYPGSTTAAHEYGHTLGLDHPHHLDIRGQGTPGIMYPRGTLVDAVFQYDPAVRAGEKGGTLHPMHRRVLPNDIKGLHLHRLSFRNGKAVVGVFSSVYHWPHLPGME